ncbi:MAG TPA: serine/threonine-protein kinase [Candidatus Aquilonibacter sp.]|jgi:serine/threonine protein kinase|nr:serine/threonine-protein kinase [Candidatus Aquilonibacter sp.]
MSTKIGHFEILSELSKSATSVVYKANDPETSQTVALKAIQLSAFGEHAAELEKCLLEEAEAVKVLSHSNLAPVFGASVIDGQVCAAMEYIQGNSVATMLARKEGFSIWDLLDIGRQVCGGLDHAHSHKVFHYSLEPGKIMCGWDGTVRVLSFGVSSVGKFTAQMPDVPYILHYMSPEQIRGESIDARSNLFSLGALFYEMVTDRKAFDREDAESLRQSILESTPVPPMHVNPKLHPVLSDLIMKALAKDPDERYQSGRELLDDLEKCKESKSQAVKAPAAQAKAPAIAAPANAAAAQAKFASAATTPVEKKPAAPAPPKPAPQPAVAKKEVGQKAVAAAAGWGGSAESTSSTPNLEQSSPAIASRANVNIDAPPPSASMSAAVLDEPEVEAPAPQSPKIAVDPMMAGGGQSRGGVSFSEMTELPPLKEVYVAPPPPPPVYEAPKSQAPNMKAGAEDEKPKIQPREVAEKAIKEIKNVPPSLMIYSIAGAAVLILIIAIVLVLHVNRLNSDDDGGRPAPEPATQTAASQPAPAQPAQPQQPALSAPVSDQPTANVVENEPAPTHAAATAARGKNGKKKSAAPAAPAIVPGLMSVDSSPQGAQVQLDGKTDPAWVTPFTLSGVDPGQHTVTISKAGYSTDTRTVEITSGSKAFVVSHLNQVMATLSVASTPPGANVYVDGRDTGKLTPAQVSVDKGQHVVLVRKAGYIDETTSAQFVLAQTVSFSPTLRALGNVDDIKTVGKMNKLFGGKGAQGMGTVSIKTQPKGAQVAVNQHMLDKGSPVDFVLDPGNYVVDITLTGYAPIHKVITVDKGGKAVIDEVMQHQ